MPNTPLSAGQSLHGFLLTDVTPLSELNATLFELEHQATGARMVHLQAKDHNNLFAVGFRTPPADSTGIAHILEHIALCGSQRFPVRDPFFSMLKRSLNTFMNAMTASDWTLYPFSSQNRKDFQNLLGIYLDAAFFPLLKQRDFLQEGWRLEFSDPETTDSPLLYKGVVYNEMKGAMSDPSSLLSRRLNKALYPTTTYHFNSGGEPTDIPLLNWEDLRAFHAAYYHPSNAYFFTYGDFPLEGHLKAIEEKALRHFSRRNSDSAVPPEVRHREPRRVTETFPVDAGQPLEKKTMVQVAWLTCDINDSLDRLGLALLSTLLLGNPAAPLYKALLDSRLGTNLAPGAGFHDDYRTTNFATGLQGTEPDQTEAIEALVLSTLERVASEGFSEERIAAAIHRHEFATLEVSGDQYPYALNLLMRLIGPWIHGGAPAETLQFTEKLDRLRREIAAGPYFQELIRKYLLDNRHRITLTLRPDPEQGPREAQAVAAALENTRAALDDEQRATIRRQALELQQSQEAEEDLSCLPTLELSDIEAREDSIPCSMTSNSGTTVHWFDQPTNGIVYFTAHLDTAVLPQELLPYVPLFCTLLTQVGAAGLSYLEMAQRMEAATGGIFARTSVLESPLELDSHQGLVSIKAKALVRNQEAMFGILTDLFAAPDFSDLDRIDTVVNQMKTSLENSIPASGHSFAARSAASLLTAGAQLREAWSGLSQVTLVRGVAALKRDELGEVAQKLGTIADTLLARTTLHCAVTAEQPVFEQVEPSLGSFLSGLRLGAEAQGCPAAPPPRSRERQGWATSLPVNYVARAFRAVPYCHDDSAALLVLAKLLRANYLHREIREKGGAYGGMASYDSEAGVFALLSYRDPHLARTLRVYDQAIAWAASGDFSDEAIKEAILAVFSDLDRPLSPGGRGSREFANLRHGLTLEMRNRLRERVLAMDRDTLVEAVRRYLTTEQARSTVAVVGSESALKGANEELGEMGLAIDQL